MLALHRGSIMVIMLYCPPLWRKLIQLPSAPTSEPLVCTISVLRGVTSRIFGYIWQHSLFQNTQKEWQLMVCDIHGLLPFDLFLHIHVAAFALTTQCVVNSVLWILVWQSITTIYQRLNLHLAFLHECSVQVLINCCTYNFSGGLRQSPLGLSCPSSMF